VVDQRRPGRPQDGPGGGGPQLTPPPSVFVAVKFTVDAINKGDWKPESTDGFDRISSVDTPDSLTANPTGTATYDRRCGSSWVTKTSTSRSSK
jgi:hypothetical protein